MEPRTAQPHTINDFMCVALLNPVRHPKKRNLNIINVFKISSLMSDLTHTQFYISHVHCNSLLSHGNLDQVTDGLIFWHASCELTHRRFLSSMNSKRHTHATWLSHPTFKSTTTQCKESHRSTTNMQKDTQAVESSEYKKQQSCIRRKFQTQLKLANIKKDKKQQTKIHAFSTRPLIKLTQTHEHTEKHTRTHTDTHTATHTQTHTHTNTHTHRKHRHKSQRENTEKTHRQKTHREKTQREHTEKENADRKHRQKTQRENTERKHRQKTHREKTQREHTERENTERKHRENTQRENFGRCLMTIFKDSHHFSRTLGDVWWQSLKTAITSVELWAMFDDNL